MGLLGGINGQVRVKNTFVDIEFTSELSPSHAAIGLRGRASSDPGLFEKSDRFDEMPDVETSDSGEVVMTMTGLSDGISDADTDVEDKLTVSLQCYSHLHHDIVTTSLTGELANMSDSSSQVTTETNSVVGQPLQKEMKRLAVENARLAEENRLLAERCREATTMASAAVAVAYQHPGHPNASAVPPVGADQAFIGGDMIRWGWGGADVASPQLVCFAMPLMLEQRHAQPRGQQRNRQHVQQRPLGASLSQQQQQQQQWQQLQQPGSDVLGLDGGSKGKFQKAQRSQRASTGPSQAIPAHSNSQMAEGTKSVQGHFQKDGGTNASEFRTTVMLRNLPNNYSRTMLLAMIDGEGFAGQYDFVYLPMDFNTRACLGYAFVNLTSHTYAQKFWKTFNGYSDWVIPSRKLCGVSWSHPHQGLQANIDRYRNSPVMHEAVPDEYKPVFFVDGVQGPFPLATKKLRVPRIRNYALPVGGSATFNSSSSEA
eukprot:CAMPEP_0117480874 /NCGR_PEP_ID=MMETSP0784-20121206/12613_1 /TAXON_ID=39447 /ORGANISM="" /LENGTH=483 /DNA_ID=CAMNT_0005275321 /DNA_START=76 /DNA_END=1527 /DNA_ORIENTATION=+